MRFIDQLISSSTEKSIRVIDLIAFNADHFLTFNLCMIIVLGVITSTARAGEEEPHEKSITEQLLKSEEIQRYEELAPRTPVEPGFNFDPNVVQPCRDDTPRIRGVSQTTVFAKESTEVTLFIGRLSSECFQGVHLLGTKGRLQSTQIRVC